MSDIQLTAMQKMFINTLGIDFAEINTMKSKAEDFMLSAKIIAEKQQETEVLLKVIINTLSIVQRNLNEMRNKEPINLYEDN